VTVDLIDEILPSEVNKIIDYVGEDAYEKGEFDKATSIFYHLITQKDYVEFLTLPAYDEIN
jgi:malate synthase